MHRGLYDLLEGDVADQWPEDITFHMGVVADFEDYAYVEDFEEIFEDEGIALHSRFTNEFDGKVAGGFWAILSQSQKWKMAVTMMDNYIVEYFEEVDSTI